MTHTYRVPQELKLGQHIVIEAQGTERSGYIRSASKNYDYNWQLTSWDIELNDANGRCVAYWKGEIDGGHITCVDGESMAVLRLSPKMVEIDLTKEDPIEDSNWDNDESNTAAYTTTEVDLYQRAMLAGADRKEAERFAHKVVTGQSVDEVVWITFRPSEVWSPVKDIEKAYEMAIEENLERDIEEARQLARDLYQLALTIETHVAKGAKSVTALDAQTLVDRTYLSWEKAVNMQVEITIENLHRSLES